MQLFNMSTISCEQLSHELALRNINSLAKKDELTKRLQQEMGGVQRVPTVLFGTESKTMEDLGFSQYEITLCEPLHNYSNHVKYLLQEIPSHLAKEEKELLVSATEAIFKDKL